MASIGGDGNYREISTLPEEDRQPTFTVDPRDGNHGFETPTVSPFRKNGCTFSVRWSTPSNVKVADVSDWGVTHRIVIPFGQDVGQIVERGFR